MYRFHSAGDQQAIRRHRRQRMQLNRLTPGLRSLDPGRCRKMDGFDCGITNCSLCRGIRSHLLWHRRRAGKQLLMELALWLD